MVKSSHFLFRSDDWHKRYLGLAEEVASWSKDPSRKIGAVAVGSKGQVLAQGYNGFPRGIDDDPVRLQDREVKYKYVVHAEMNLIYNATYNGVSLDGSTVYVTGLPVCSECAKGLIQVGVRHVVMKKQDDLPPVWQESFEFTKSLFNEANITWKII
jgi:dCMP deaminase